MIELSLDLVRMAAKAAVAKKGERHVYSNEGFSDSYSDCLYVHGDQPGCVVGDILHRLGVPLETLRESEGQLATELLGRLEASEVIAKVPSNVKDYLQNLQLAQDYNHPWGEALKRAEEEL